MQYPWWATNCYTIGERNTIFRSTVQLLQTLSDFLQRNGSDGPMTMVLLEDLLHAALDVPVFSEFQRSQLIDACSQMVPVKTYVPAIAPLWPFEVLRCYKEADGPMLEVGRINKRLQAD